MSMVISAPSRHYASQTATDGGGQVAAAPTQQWEQALVLIALKRDKQAFSELFSYFAPRLRAFGIRMFGNEQLAMEMVQDTLLNVWNKAGLFDPARGCATTWIYTIARNVRFDMLRKKQQRKDEISADDLWADGEQPDVEGDHSQQWDLLLIAEKLAPHFQALPPSQREVVEKVYLEELSHQQVAELLAIPLGTVKSRLRLALERLREVFHESEC